MNTTAGNLGLNQDFREFVQLLNANNVRYLVVGGYAVAVHGHPRYTKDIDIWVDTKVENARRILTALDEFGFGSLDIDEADLTVTGKIVQLGSPPRRIDLITSLPGVEFDECHSSRIDIDVEGVDVNFIDLANLKKNKQASGRPQDLADLDNLP